MSYGEPEYYASYRSYSPAGSSFSAYSPVSDTTTGCSSVSYTPSPDPSCSYLPASLPSPYSTTSYAEVSWQGDWQKHGAQLHYAASLELDAALRAEDIGRCLGCLDNLATAIPFRDAPYPTGMRDWLKSVQKVTNMVKRRSVIGTPVTREEGAEIKSFVMRWLGYRGGANDMGAPEAQIVLLTLEECLILF